MRRSEAIQAKVKAVILRHELIQPGELVLLAVSGGRDSVTMLALLAALAASLRFRLAVANFNHHLRPEAAAEAEFVAALAARYGLPCYLGGAEIGALAQGRNLQETARRERYAFLRKTAAQIGAAKIAVAHHQGDQAETLLLHLLRGAGGEGLAAMAREEDGIIRPLLELSEAEIAAYQQEQALAFCQDASNFSTKYLRNRIRLELLPQLAAYNPRVVEALAATADICREDHQLLEDLAEQELAALWLDEAGALAAPGFDALPLALRRRLLRKAFCLVAGEQSELSFQQIGAVLALHEEQACTLPGRIWAYRRGHLYLSREAPPPLPEHRQEFPLQVDGVWHQLGDWGWQYQAEQALCPAYLSADHLALPLAEAEEACFRTRRPGDAVYSAGKTGRKKLKELFIDAKIPPYRRNSWPVLVVEQRIRWLPQLYRPDERSEIQPNQSIILIKMQKSDTIL